MFLICFTHLNFSIDFTKMSHVGCLGNRTSILSGDVLNNFIVCIGKIKNTRIKREKPRTKMKNLTLLVRVSCF